MKRQSVFARPPVAAYHVSVNARHGAGSLSAIVLAAGEGKRMRTLRAKVLHEAGGRALLDHVLAALEPLAPAPLVVVVGHLREQVEAHLAGRGAVLAVQEPPKGTGDAVARALPHLPDDGETLVLSGDVPLITTATLKALVELRRSRGAAGALVSAVPGEPGNYGRIVRNQAGEVIGVVEARDVTPEQRGIGEVNAGMYVFELAALRWAISRLRPDNAQGEYYLTDAIGLLASEGHRVAAFRLQDPDEMTGVNSRADLAEVHRLLNARVVRRLAEAGVTVLDPATTWVDADCTVGGDTVLEAGVHLRRGCSVGVRCRIGAHSVLDGVTVPDDGVVAPLTRRRGK
jgi:bifunctional UDP-N-acetylglucosamine pyrophosphorylase / glucosamine-1-phosphate N-acetyltransferase